MENSLNVMKTAIDDGKNYGLLADAVRYSGSDMSSISELFKVCS